MLAATEGALDAAKSSLFGLSAHLRRKCLKPIGASEGSEARWRLDALQGWAHPFASASAYRCQVSGHCYRQPC